MSLQSVGNCQSPVKVAPSCGWRPSFDGAALLLYVGAAAFVVEKVLVGHRHPKLTADAGGNALSKPLVIGACVRSRTLHARAPRCRPPGPLWVALEGGLKTQPYFGLLD